MSEKIKTIQIIHFAICTGVIIAYFIIGDLSTFEKIKIPNIDSSSGIYLLIPILAFLSSNFLYKSQIKNINKEIKLKEKIELYQTATIIRLTILEGSAFLILILIPDFLIFGILLILYIIIIRPTENQFRRNFEKN